MPYLPLTNFNYDSGPHRIQSGPNHEGYTVLYSGVQSTGPDEGIVVAGAPLSGTLALGAWDYDANWRYIPSTLPTQSGVLDPTPYNVSGALGTYDGVRIYTRNNVAGAQIASVIGPQPGSTVNRPEKYMYFGGAAPDNQNYSPYNTPDANSAAEGKTGGGVTHRTFESSLLTNVLGSQGTADRSQWRYHQPVYCKTYTETKRSEVPGLMSTSIRTIYRGGSTSYNYNYGGELLASKGGVGGGGGLYAELESGGGGGGGITLAGPAEVFEGSITDPYIVSLSDISLANGQQVTFTVNSVSGSATKGVDFTALTAGDLLPAIGITLSGISTDGINGAVTVTATNTSGNILATGAELLNFTIRTTGDSTTEGLETFSITLTSSTTNVVNSEVVSTIIEPTYYSYWRWDPASPWNSTASFKPLFQTPFNDPPINLRPVTNQDWFGGGGTITVTAGSVAGVLVTFSIIQISNGQSVGNFFITGSVNKDNPFNFTPLTFEFSNDQSTVIRTWAGRADIS